MGRMKTSVLICINNFFFQFERNNYCTILPMVANFVYIVPTRLGIGCTFLFQEENLDGKDDNFCTYMHKYFFSSLKEITIVQLYPWLQILSIQCPLDQEQGAHFSFRKKIWMGKITTSVLIRINNIFPILKVIIILLYNSTHGCKFLLQCLLEQ